MWRLIALLALLSTPAYAWELPEGAVWQMKGGGCELSADAKQGKIFPFLKSCYFGTDATLHQGVAFFRVCHTRPGATDIMEKDPEPFLIVDFELEIYMLQYYGHILDVGAIGHGGFDPVPKFREFFGSPEVNARDCWAPADNSVPL